jgi:hypothetical protein
MKFEDEITYQTLKLEKKGGKRDGDLQGFFKRPGFDRGRHVDYSNNLKKLSSRESRKENPPLFVKF